LWASQRIDPGFGQDPALLVGLAPGVAGLDDVRSRAFFNQLVERVSALPGVRGAALARRIPLSPMGGGATLPVVVPSRPLEPGQEPDKLRYNVVSRGYFNVMHIRLLRGRDFAAADGPDSARVVIINDAMARRYFPDDDPIGRTIRVGVPTSTDWRIIGIAQNGRYVELTEAPEPHLFFPFSQRSSGEMTLIARTSGDGRVDAEAVRREIRTLSPGMPTLQILTLKEHLRFALYGPELIATLVSAIGIAGLLLAMVGLYGVISSLVGQRTHDIGIRMALGASRREVTAAVIAQGIGLAGAGVAVGLAGAFWASRFLQGNLYGVSAGDPLTFAAAAFLVIAVTAVASYIPARRAARVDPLVALRYE
jgi:predicted permease